MSAEAMLERELDKARWCPIRSRRDGRWAAHRPNPEGHCVDCGRKT